jgi:hypothetical protein
MGEQQQQQQATGQEQQQQQQQQQEPKKIELDEETYAALLDKIDELEGKVTPKGKQQKQSDDEDEDEVDRLAREGRQQQGRQQELNLDDMSPSQLVKVIQDQVRQEIAGPIFVAVNELKYTMEIDKLTRPKEMGGEGIKDLMDYKDDIMALMLENPKMTMKRAYTLAKVENPEKSKQDTQASDGRDRDARLRHLPPHPKRAFGERPGQAEASTTEGEPKDLKGAVTKAFDEVFKGQNV